MSVPVVAVLDLHANVSERMVQNSACLFSYRKNPHTDSREAAIEAAKRLQLLVEGAECAQVYLPCLYVLPPSGIATENDPLKTVLRRAREMAMHDDDLICICRHARLRALSYCVYSR